MDAGRGGGGGLGAVQDIADPFLAAGTDHGEQEPVAPTARCSVCLFQKLFLLAASSSLSFSGVRVPTPGRARGIGGQGEVGRGEV